MIQLTAFHWVKNYSHTCFSDEKSSRIERFLPKRGNLSKALSVDASDARHKIFKLKKNKSVDDRQNILFENQSTLMAVPPFGGHKNTSFNNAFKEHPRGFSFSRMF